MSGKARKTAVLTVRLSKELNDVLLEDAEQNGITASSLVNRIVKKYVEWDRHAEKFKFVSIAAETFRVLVESVDENAAKKIKSLVESGIPEAVTLFWFKKLNLETILKYISLYGKYTGQYTSEVDFREGNHVVTIHHEFGKRWSTTIGSDLSQFISRELGVVPQTQTTDNTAMITFRAEDQHTPA